MDIPDFQKTVLLTVANFGYFDMLLNFFHTLQLVNSSRLKEMYVFTYDRRLMEALIPYSCIQCRYIQYDGPDGRAVSSDAVKFNSSEWNVVTKFKLLAIWKVLEAGFDVFYFDPDIAFVRDPLAAGDVSNFSIQLGKPYCSGVMFVKHTDAQSKSLFDPRLWAVSKMNDEHYLTHIIKERKVPVKTFDFELYPNGLVWEYDLKVGVLKAKELISKKAVLFHFNFVSTPQAKLQRMRDLGLYVPTMQVFSALADGPANEDEVLFRKFVFERLKTGLISSKRHYIDAKWIPATNSSVNPSPLKIWCWNLFKDHPDKMFWTVSRACDTKMTEMQIIPLKRTTVYQRSANTMLRNGDYEVLPSSLDELLNTHCF